MKRLLLLLVLILAACAPLTPSTRTLALAPDANDISLDPLTAYGLLTVSQSGTEADPIVVWGNGATVQCVDLKGSYIVLNGVTVQGCASHGILIRGQYITVTGNLVRHTVTSNGTDKCAGTGQWGSAIKVYLGGQHIQITDNRVEQNCGEGIAVTRGVDVAVLRNVVIDAFSVGIYVDNSQDVTVRDNTIRCSDPAYYRNNAPARGMLIGAENYSGWGFQLRDATLEANRVESCLGVRYYSQLSGTPSGISVRDNLFVNVPAPAVSLPTWASVTGNIVTTATPNAGGTPPATLTARPSPTPTRTPSLVPTRTPTPTPECYRLNTSRGPLTVCFE